MFRITNFSLDTIHLYRQPQLDSFRACVQVVYRLHGKAAELSLANS